MLALWCLTLHGHSPKPEMRDKLKGQYQEPQLQDKPKDQYQEQFREQIKDIDEIQTLTSSFPSSTSSSSSPSPSPSSTSSSSSSSSSSSTSSSSFQSSDSQAQDSQAQDLPRKTIRIAPLEVHATRPLRLSAATRTVIDSSAIAESVNLSLSELLTKHSPIFVKSYGLGSMATVSFRGTAPSHTQVEWNGINVNNPMVGQVDFSMLPVWMIDNAELLHGGSSLSNGGGALGGSVVLGSRAKWDKKIYGSLMQGIGSFGNYQTSAQVGGGNQKVQVSARYIYQQAKNDFKYLNTAIPPFEYTRQKNADYRKHTATADLFLRLAGNHNLSLSGWLTMADRNLPHIMSYQGRGRDEWQKDQEHRASMRWWFYTPKVRSELVVGYNATRLDYLLASQTDLGSVTNQDSRSASTTLQSRYKIDWHIGPNTSLGGLLNLSHSRVSTLERQTATGYSAQRSELGLSASVHQRLGSGVSGYLLLRGESSGAFIPSLGLEYEPLGDLVLKLNATRNYHQPTLNDLHWLPGGNPDLRPEKGYTADLSAQYKLKDYLSLSATGFLSLIDDWIIWQPSEYRYWSASNIKTVLSTGVELNFRLAHTFSGVKLSLSGNYAFTRTTNQEPNLPGDESRGKQLIYIPRHKANLMLDASYKGFYLCYTWGLTGQRFTTSSNQATRHTLPMYDLHNITIGKTFKYVDLQFKVENLFNKDYQAILWRAMPQRNYTLLVKFTI